jgi:fermentation-respiration switch protein FrsA (DUF1100 family)
VYRAGSLKEVFMLFTRLVFLIIFSALISCSPLVNKFAFFPDTTHTVSERSLPGPIQKVIIKTADRVALSCFFIRNSKSNRLVIYFPGNAGNIDQRLSELIRFSNLGVNVLGVGYRGFGKSTGKPSEMGIYKDGYAALIYAKDSLGFPSDSIFVCGRSIGTTVAIEISHKTNLSGVILITPLTTGKDMAKLMGLGWLSPFIGNPFDNLGKCSSIISPVLVLHGTADETLPFAMGQTIFSHIKSRKKFIRIENGHHNDLERVDPQLFWESIDGFINNKSD